MEVLDLALHREQLTVLRRDGLLLLTLQLTDEVVLVEQLTLHLREFVAQLRHAFVAKLLWIKNVIRCCSERAAAVSFYENFKLPL